MLSTSNYDLLKSCIRPSSTLEKDYQHLKDIYPIIVKSRTALPGPSMGNRKLALQNFESWLLKNDISMDNISLKETENGCGVFAKRTIDKSERLIEIGQDLMITTIPNDHLLQSMIESDVLLQSFKNLVLILQLLKQANDVNSFWKDYIQALPTEFALPMFFSLDEFESMKGLSVMHDCIKDVFHSIRQYCHLYRLLTKYPFIPLNTLTFSSFEWARAVTLTRQNEIKVQIGDTVENHLSLIPLYDMFNHSAGEVSIVLLDR